MSLVCYIPNICGGFPVKKRTLVDSWFYPVPTPSPQRTGFGIDIKAYSKVSFERAWNIFDSEDTIRK